MNVLISITVLGFLIFFHELGHFLAAISLGIKVNQFSIGFGPSILKKQKDGITYALRAFPLGGFVSFPGDETDHEFPKDHPDILKNRPIFDRAIVISAGVVFNLLLAWIVLIGQISFSGLPDQLNPGVVIMSVQADSAASIAGLSAGDQIISIDGIKLGKDKEAVKELVKKIQSSPGDKLSIERIKGDKLDTINLVPFEYLGKGKIGAQLQQNISNKTRPVNGPIEAITSTNTQFFDLLNKTIQGYKGLITNFETTSKQLSGPVKIVEIGAQLSQQGVNGLILFTALISINLAVLNSLPLPLLDGGQLALLILEGIRGKPIPEKIQLVFMQSGFVLLVGLSVVLIIRDTSQLSLVQNLINP